MQPTTPGVLEVITGPMFSGKSEELIRRLKRARIARQRVACYKPDIDLRYHRAAIACHSYANPRGLPIASSKSFAPSSTRSSTKSKSSASTKSSSSPKIIPVTLDLVALGKRVLMAGLDTTFANEPFGPVPNLMALADRVTKLSAVCMVCGQPAIHTQRLGECQELVVVGAAGLYEARCRAHFTPHLDAQGSEQLEFPAAVTTT